MTSNINEKLSSADREEQSGPLVMAARAEPRARALRSVVRYLELCTLAYGHLAALYGLYLTASAKWATIMFYVLIYLLSGWGISAGAHRLWTHRAYRATLPLQILFMLLQTLSCQQCVLKWARNHRLHHKYCDTDADPYNARRGLFFSHIGWLLVEKHPDVLRKGKTIDMSDLMNNPVLQFQEKYYRLLNTVISFVLPVLVPVVFWHEDVRTAHHVQLLFLMLGIHVSFCINSVAHAFGSKPYDSTITPTQNAAMNWLAFGEGHHNYHHAFPFDYRVSELGSGCSTGLIELLAWVGWAYDLKQATPDMIANRANRTGDGTPRLGRMNNGAKNK